MQVRLSLLLALLFSLALPPAAHAEFEYSLDDLERVTEVKGKLRCPKLEMTRHKGESVRYHKPVYVYVDFQERLEAFESIVAELATEIYGRAPKRIKHVGTYNCRRIRRFPDLLSEHALGNAIDIEGFDFAPARGADQRKDSPHKRLRRGFKVRVGKHWDKEKGVSAIHARFLRELTDRLIEDDTFRVLLGPAFPGHQDHFHFDLAPYRLVQL
jgi:hypothetical protein